jgi:transcription antitermination factor NusG
MGTQGSTSSSHWFAIYTASRHEKHVAEQLNDRQFETFLPLYRAVHVWKNRSKVTLDLPLFPCYLFARSGPERRGNLLSVPGVLSIVGSKQESWPLPDAEVEALRSGLQQHNAVPHSYLAVGDRARITNGPFAGMEGVVLRQNNGLRVVLSFSHIMRSFSVEVNVCDLEPLPPLSSRRDITQLNQYQALATKL